MASTSIVFGLHDTPPFLVAVGNALQHVALTTAIGMAFPLIILRVIGADHEVQRAVIGCSFLILAIGTALQCLGRRGVGSGYLLPVIFTAAYLPPSIVAAQQGGLPLVAGMTIFAGLCQAAIAPFLRQFRPYLPSEIAGLAVTMIGIILGLLGFRLLFGLDPSGGLMRQSITEAALPGLVAFGATVAAAVWGAGGIRLFAALIGLVLGIGLAAGLDQISATQIQVAMDAPVFALPLPVTGWPVFDPALAPQFFVASLACALRAVGDLTTVQRLNDPAWRRPDFITLQRGVLADGAATLVAGGLGTVGMNTSSPSVGLSVATGITSRLVGFYVAAIMLLLALLPFAQGLVLLIPPAVTGGILVFSAAFIVINGIQVMTSRMLDNRRMLTLGLALLFGLGRDVFPDFYGSAPAWVGAVLASDLIIAIGGAIALNALFRIGITRAATLSLALEPDDIGRLHDFIGRQGRMWGARPEVMHKITTALVELVEAAPSLGIAGCPAVLRLTFDETRIIAKVSYAGPALPAAEPPQPLEALEKLDIDEAIRRSQVALLMRLADRTTLSHAGGRQTLRLRFEH